MAGAESSGVDLVVLKELAPHERSPALRPYDEPLSLAEDKVKLNVYLYVALPHLALSLAGCGLGSGPAMLPVHVYPW